MDFIQRGTGISDEISEKASPDWTKSNQTGEFREKAAFDWTKSNEAKPGAESRTRRERHPAENGIPQRTASRRERHPAENGILQRTAKPPFLAGSDSQASRTHRKPILPEALSGVFALRAATR